MRVVVIFLAGLLCTSNLPGALAQATSPEEFFETRIRPVLSEKCFSCHTDPKIGALRADSREGLLKGGGYGPAIVLGDPEESLLIKAVSHTHERLKMPLGQPKLNDQEIADLKAWVKMGAPWPLSGRESGKPTASTSKATEFVITPEQRQFWSFQPCNKPAVPTVNNKTWTKSSIDNFILARLEAQGLTPVSPANKTVLIRRAYFDLIGLPPKPEEIEAFLVDKSPNAFAKIVDGLLASPHYGERWGRYWLDVARYGESDVTQGAPQEGFYANAWRYRDWVIKAFNDDMPYNLFVKAQIAGDLLDSRNREEFVAGTGFLGLGPWYYGLAGPAQARADERNDRIDTVTRGFLGLTMACARCHNHKSDPFSTSDYYALAGVFASSQYREYPLAPATVADLDRHKKKMRELEAAINTFTDTQSKQLSQMLAWHTSRYLIATWRVIQGPSTSSQVAGEEKLDLQTLEKWVRYLTAPEKDHPFLKAWHDLLAQGGTLDQVKKVADDFQAAVLSVLAERRQLDDEAKIIQAQNKPKKEDVREKIPLPNGFVAYEEAALRSQLPPGRAMERDRFYLWLDLFTEDDPVDPTQRNDGVLVYKGQEGEKLDRFLGGEWKAHLDSMRAEVATLKQSMPSFLHGMAESPRARNLRVYLRGSPDNLGEEVPRRFISVLSKEEPALFKNGSGRLELAETIARHPLAARVMVNRVWQYHFGNGIVRSASNFGETGERPSHPELLEYLTSRLIASGYSLKALHREIMLSATYELGPDYSEKNYAVDRDNRLLWRANRRRLDAEALRDALLYVSGGLDLTVGGPSAELAEDFSLETGYSLKAVVREISATDDFRRRTVYGRVSRFRPNSLLALFDFPSPSITSEQRNATNVPTQRLFFLNSDLVWRQAGFLAERLDTETNIGDEAKIRRAYRVLFGREATDAEVSLGIGFLRNAQRESAGNHAEGENGISSETILTKTHKQPARASAWQQYMQVLLGSNGFLFVN